MLVALVAVLLRPLIARRLDELGLRLVGLELRHLGRDLDDGSRSASEPRAMQTEDRNAHDHDSVVSSLTTPSFALDGVRV